MFGGFKTTVLLSTLGAAGMTIAAAIETGQRIGNSSSSVLLGIVSVFSVIGLVYQYRAREKMFQTQDEKHNEHIAAIRTAHEREMSNALAIAKVVDANTSVMSQVEGAINRCKAAQVQAEKDAKKHG